MTDVAIITTDEGTLDIDIVNGLPVLLSSENNNTEQRVAVAAYTVLGTIPGMKDTGVDWSSYFTTNRDIVSIDNQIQKSIKNSVNTSDLYLPMYLLDDDNQMNLVLMRGNE